jgi:hypothetical protein
MYPQVTQFETRARLVRQELSLRQERDAHPVRPTTQSRRRRFGLAYALRVARR